MIFKSPFTNAIPNKTQLEIEGAILHIHVRQNAKAKLYRLTLDHRLGVVLTVPKCGSWPEAQKFLHRHQNWLAARQHHIAQPVKIKSDMCIPFKGDKMRIQATGTLRGLPQCIQNTHTIHADDPLYILNVPGEADHIGRRTCDWLKKQARTELEKHVTHHCQTLNVRHKGISLRDQSTRWGSCSSKGTLNFNWRLIMAPPFVLDYVAAHEVAHLIEMNHSERFWAQVRRTLPDMARGQSWLKVHGRELFAYH